MTVHPPQGLKLIVRIPWTVAEHSMDYGSAFVVLKDPFDNFFLIHVKRRCTFIHDPENLIVGQIFDFVVAKSI